MLKLWKRTTRTTAADRTKALLEEGARSRRNQVRTEAAHGVFVAGVR